VQGPQGQQGQQGPQGNQGPAGGFDLSNIDYVTGSSASFNGGGATAQVDAVCPKGEQVIGGGYSAGWALSVEQNYAMDAQTWWVSVYEPNTAWSGTVTAYAICAS